MACIIEKQNSSIHRLRRLQGSREEAVRYKIKNIIKENSFEFELKPPKRWRIHKTCFIKLENKIQKQ